jgi:class 3 adenylate cyclase
MRISFLNKLLLVLTVLTFLIVLITSFTFNKTAKDILLKGLGEKAIELAVEASKRLDVRMYSKVLTNKIPPSKAREPLTKELLTIQNDLSKEGVENIYTIAKINDRLFIVADSSGDDDPFVVADNANAVLKKKVFEGAPAYTKEPYVDQWGTWISGYAPFHDEEGKVTGIIGIDLPLGAFPLIDRIIKRNVLFSLLPSVLFAILVSYIMSKKLTRPMKEITKGLKMVEDGNLKINIPVTSHDELGDMTQSFNNMTKGLLERERIRNLMNIVVSKEIAEEMLKGEIKLGGEEREVTILFSDIRGFTAMSEAMSPTEVIAVLNEYMSLMNQIVEKNNGVVDKYIGDSIMAIFGAPVSYKNDAARAVKTAVEMVEELKKLNRERKKMALPEISIGIGLNCGTVVAGTIGSQKRMNYTVIGDNVNVASRLCGNALPFQILVTESVYSKVKDLVNANPLGSIKVKGKTKDISVYEITGII